MLFQLQLHVVDLFELVQEPRIDRRHLGQLLHRISLAQRIAHVTQPLRMRRHQPLRQDLRLDLLRPRLLAGIKRPHALQKRFFERAPDGHHFPDGLHLRSEAFVGTGKFLELPLGDLHHHIVERRLKRRRGLARDVVGDFVERVTDRQFRRNLRDREPCRLRR